MNRSRAAYLILGLAVLLIIVFYAANQRKTPFHPAESNDGKSQTVGADNRSYPTAAPSPAVALKEPNSLKPETRQKLGVLEEIFASRNDNDPRLDSELKVLDTETKEAMRERYRKLAPEKRNEKGTIVYLLGRNLESKEDFSFFEEVLGEPKCRSLADCTKDPDKQEEGHLDIGVEITLDYPSIMVLKQLERFLADPGNKGGESWRTAEALRLLRVASAGKSERVVRMATEIQKRFSR
jgi:hypothetical protein